MRDSIVTIPPYAPFIEEVVAHPAVSGVRLNTVMPTHEPLEELLTRLKSVTDQYGKELYIDLKCRQLRVKSFGVPPFTEIELTHNISVKTPVTAYFSDGTEAAKVMKVKGNRLIMLDGPQKVVGPGESLNIPDPSLEIKGFFTPTDLEYIAAGKKTGVKNYILSFVEKKEDIALMREQYAEANIVAKIESRKGLEYVRKQYDGSVRLMAGRGDMYVELERPHQIITAMHDIVKADPKAIGASRIFTSLKHSMEPSCADIGDVDSLWRMGYQTLMFGDEICMKRNNIINALNLYGIMAKEYE